MQRFFSLLAAILALVCISVPAFPLDGSRSLSQYIHQSWGPEQGLPRGTIYAISRSGDGYLWLGTDQGLVRFDGYSFKLIQQPIPRLPRIGIVRALASDAQGALWILLDDGRLLLYRNGDFEEAFAAFSIPNVTVSAMSADGKGGILFAGIGTAIFRWGDGKLNTIADAAAIPAAVTSIVESGDGRIWLGTEGKGLYLLQQRGISKVSGFPGDNTINALALAHNGGIWIGTDRGVRFFTVHGNLVDNLPGWTHRLRILALSEGTEGSVWAGTAEGLVRITSYSAAFYPNADGRSAVNTIFEDREQELWFGGAGGLERLQDGVFSTYSTAEGFPATPVGPIFADSQGVVWFAPLSGGLYWYYDGRLRRVRQDGLDRDVIYSIDGGDGEIWIGRQRGGLTRIVRRGDTLQTRTYTIRDGLAQNSVFAVHRSPNGTIWAGTVNGGVSVLRGSRFETYSTTNGLPLNMANSIAESRDGTIWIATSSGLEEFRRGQWVNWTIKNGLPSAKVQLCFVDSQGVVWILTDAGLSYVSGGRINTLHNLPNPMREQILGITGDQLGSLWISTSDDVFRVARSALLADSIHAGDFQSYGAADGLNGIDAVHRQRSLVSDSLGQIWISLTQGIAMGEPALTSRDSLPIRVRINNVLVNGAIANLHESPGLAAGTRSVTFRFESDSLFAPSRVRFRYRLQGADPGWSDAIDPREVTYHNLAPGNYRFEVTASRNGEVWNSPETVVPFSIKPAYWQTWWFRTAGAFAVLLTILFFFRLRSIRLAHQLNARFQERLAERTRIAQELHDTLLQSFQGLMLRFQTIDNLLPARPGEAKRALEEALDRADDAVNESRRAIQNIRSSSSQDGDLAQALKAMMTEMAEEYVCEGTRRPEYSVLVEGSPRPLNRWVKDEVIRIAQESLRNSFQHSSAGRIEAEVTFGDSQFRVRFRDDGVGIDPDVLRNGSRPGHWGMIGMKERAIHLNAKFDVWSKPGAGTELDLDIPAQVAYDRFAGAKGLQTNRKMFKTKNDRRSSTNPDSDR